MMQQSKEAGPKFPLVQALRALAAISVAFYHVLFNAMSIAPAAGGLARVYHGLRWEAGVDVFFVISGFVIAHSSRRLFATPEGGRHFMIRRVARIVPLYWLMTSLFLAIAMVLPAAINGAGGNWVYVLKSYLFIPAARDDDVVQPALGLGWTLNYEMFFYLAFMPFLRFRQARAVLLGCAALAVFVLLGQAGLLSGVVLTYWANPIILEFCAGMLLALLAGRLQLADWARLGLGLVALGLFYVQPVGWPLLLSQGMPALLLVMAAISGDVAQTVPWVERWLVRLGDASYAMYLVHPFVMRGVALFWLHAHRVFGVWGYVGVCMVVAQMTALVIHFMFERRVTVALRRRLELAFV